MLHSDNGYVFLAVSPKLKTDLYNKGALDGRKRPVQLLPSYDFFNETASFLAVSREIAREKMNDQFLFSGYLSLDKMYLIDSREADKFYMSVCMDCEYYGETNCFENEFRCGEEDRERYRDTSHFESLKDIRRERKPKTLPVTG